MNLKEWRLTRKLTMAEAASRFHLDSPRTYQRYETGENRPDAPLVERFCRITDGAISVQDIHLQRLEWLRENKPELFAEREAAE